MLLRPVREQETEILIQAQALEEFTGSGSRVVAIPTEGTVADRDELAVGERRFIRIKLAEDKTYLFLGVREAARSMNHRCESAEQGSGEFGCARRDELG